MYFMQNGRYSSYVSKCTNIGDYILYSGIFITLYGKFIFITTAIQHLSARKHGALIVVERNETLEALIQTGTTLNAHLTAPLLESIFYPGNPLHDGAVLVKIIILSQLLIFFL